MNEETQGWNGDGSGYGAWRVKEKRICGTKLRRSVDVMWITGKTWIEEVKNQLECIGSVAANQENLENSNEAGRITQGTQGLRKNFRCIGSVSSLSRVMRYFRNKCHLYLLGRTNTSSMKLLE